MTDEKYRVLILDDDYELGELLREYLQNTRTCTVTYVTTEPDFWDCIGKETFDILFLDYKLPSTTGLDILARMGQSGYNIPTVMMTGEGNESIAARAIQNGALDYLVKGEYSFSVLPPLIQKAVRLREMQRAMQQYLEQIRYQAMLLNNMRDAVVVWGLDGAITYWNNAAEQLYGAPASARLGKRVQDIYFPCFDPPLSWQRIQGAGNLQIEHRFQLPGSDKIWVSTHITTLFNEGNKNDPIGYMNVARDITPRKLEQEALVKSQHFIKRILDTSPNIIYTFDLRTRRITYINPEVKAILGFSIEEFLHASFDLFAEHVHTSDRPALAQHLHDLQSLKNGEVLEIEYRFLSANAGWRWLKSRETIFSRSSSASGAGAGSPAEIIGVMQDITASKLAEAKLQRRLDSEKLISTISNNFINLARSQADKGIAEAMGWVANFLQVDYGVIFLQEDGQLTPYYSCPVGEAAQPEFTHNTVIQGQIGTWLREQLDRKEVVVIDRLEAMPDEAGDDRRKIEAMGLRSMILSPMVFNNALYGILGFASSQQELGWTEDDLYVLKTFSEMITNALVQKQVDQALRKSEARYRAIVEDHQTEMICRFLPNTTLTFVNEAYCRFYGFERSQLVGTSFLDPVLEAEKEHVQAELASLSTDTPVHVHEQRVQRASGETRWQEWVSRAIFDQHNDFIEFQAVGRDITERKAMEEQIKTAQTHLAQAARLASIGELASSVAHQISNPLTTIIADAQILSSQLNRDHPARESADAIMQAGWRAQQVINELMKFSQPAQATNEPVSINDTIDAALLLASAHIQASGVQLTVDLASDMPEISGNPRQLTDLWVNLFLLARSAFVNGSEHHLRVQSRLQDKNTIVVDVTDNGIPIPPEQYDTIFEPQLLPTGSGRGTGMELSLCREIVRLNRGQISVSGNGQETSFHILFSVEGT